MFNYTRKTLVHLLQLVRTGRRRFGTCGQIPSREISLAAFPLQGRRLRGVGVKALSRRLRGAARLGISISDLSHQHIANRPQ